MISKFVDNTKIGWVVNSEGCRLQEGTDGSVRWTEHYKWYLTVINAR